MLVDIVEQLREFVKERKDEEIPWLGKKRIIEYDLQGTFHVYWDRESPDKIEVISFEGDLFSYTSYASSKERIDIGQKVRPTDNGWSLIADTKIKLSELTRSASYVANIQGSHVEILVLSFSHNHAELEELKKRNLPRYMTEEYCLV